MAATCSCIHCGVAFKANPELLGKRVKCPQCHEDFVVSAGVGQLEVLRTPAESRDTDDPLAMSVDVSPLGAGHARDPLAGSFGGLSAGNTPLSPTGSVATPVMAPPAKPRAPTKGGLSRRAWIGIAGGVAVLVLGCGGVVDLMLLLMMRASRYTSTTDGFAQIGMAMNRYHSEHNRLPLAGSEDSSLGEGLSWRVRILPHLGQQDLYDQFHHDEAWDSAHNLAVGKTMPDIYRCPRYSTRLDDNTTVYLGVSSPAGNAYSFAQGKVAVGEGGPLTKTAFSPDPPFAVRYRDITDGVANTIMVVEADASEAVVWTKPADWELDLADFRRGLGTLRGSGFNALFVDGSVRRIPNSIDDETLFCLFCVDDQRSVTIPTR